MEIKKLTSTMLSEAITSLKKHNLEHKYYVLPVGSFQIPSFKLVQQRKEEKYFNCAGFQSDPPAK